jgi:hypothetical protein
MISKLAWKRNTREKTFMAGIEVLEAHVDIWPTTPKITTLEATTSPQRCSHLRHKIVEGAVESMNEMALERIKQERTRRLG